MKELMNYPQFSASSVEMPELTTKNTLVPYLHQKESYILGNCKLYLKLEYQMFLPKY
jgi:hypothetical protein